jgi:hypothetical protein
MDMSGRRSVTLQPATASVQPVAAYPSTRSHSEDGKCFAGSYSPTRMPRQSDSGLVLWQHVVPALVVQHAQSEKYLVPHITRKKSGDKRSFIWVHKIPQHVSVIIIG